jgi:hypothetical protein
MKVAISLEPGWQIFGRKGSLESLIFFRSSQGSKSHNIRTELSCVGFI